MVEDVAAVLAQKASAKGLELACKIDKAVPGRLRGDGDGNVSESDGHMTIDAANNYIFSPRKFVALVGVENLVIVDTEDALLVVHRDRSQDVGKIVKELGLSEHTELI